LLLIELTNRVCGLLQSRVGGGILRQRFVAIRDDDALHGEKLRTDYFALCFRLGDRTFIAVS
jgi:hypothetical protein